MEEIVVFKLGHDIFSEYHNKAHGIFVPVLSSANEKSPCYDSRNWLGSEFTSISKVFNNDLSKYKYIGLSQYRTIVANQDDNSSYFDLLDHSEQLIKEYLSDPKVDGIIGMPFGHGDWPNKISKARWTGTGSLDNVRKVIAKKYPMLIDDFNRYLESTQNSYRVTNVLKRRLFYEVFSIVNDTYDDFYHLRVESNTLYPRSIGYDLEDLTSFLLTRASWYNNILRVNLKVLLPEFFGR